MKEKSSSGCDIHDHWYDNEGRWQQAGSFRCRYQESSECIACNLVQACISLAVIQGLDEKCKGITLVRMYLSTINAV